MIQTWIIYTSLILVMMLLSIHAKQMRRFWPISVALLCYAAVFGCRYGVGVDHLQYLKAYKYALVMGQLRHRFQEHWEWGFRAGTELFSGLQIHYCIYFGVIAYIQLWLFYHTIRREYRLFPFLTFTYMVGSYWLTFNNGMRQVLALGIFFAAIPYLRQHRKVWLYVALILLASLMHKSAIILLPLIFLYRLRKSYFNNIKIEYLLLLCALVIMNLGVVQGYFQSLNAIIRMMDYDHYADSNHAEAQNIRIGLGFALTLVNALIFIYYSNHVKALVGQRIRWYAITYDLFFMGLLIKYAFIGIQLMGRINYYLLYMDFFIGACTMFYLLNRKKYIPFAAVTGIYLMTFVAVLFRMDENTALFRFFWQV